MVKRVSPARTLDDLWLATSTSPADDPLAEWAERCRLECFRGDEEDVLTRFIGCAQAASADVVVRLCGDSPLHDGRVVDAVVAVYLADPDAYDYVSNVQPDTSIEGQAVEVMPLSVLLRSNEQCHDPRMREHVTLYVRTNPETYRHGVYRHPPITASTDGLWTRRRTWHSCEQYMRCWEPKGTSAPTTSCNCSRSAPTSVPSTRTSNVTLGTATFWARSR